MIRKDNKKDRGKTPNIPPDITLILFWN